MKQYAKFTLAFIFLVQIFFVHAIFAQDLGDFFTQRMTGMQNFNQLQTFAIDGNIKKRILTTEKKIDSKENKNQSKVNTVKKQAIENLGKEINKESILQSINQVRKRISSQFLVHDEELQKIARKKINDMIVKKYFGHYDNNGYSLVQNIVDTEGKLLGENLVFSAKKSELQNLLEISPSHRHNMQMRIWRKVGIAMGQDLEGNWYMVQIFGK